MIMTRNMQWLFAAEYDAMIHNSMLRYQKYKIHESAYEHETYDINVINYCVTSFFSICCAALANFNNPSVHVSKSPDARQYTYSSA